MSATRSLLATIATGVVVIASVGMPSGAYGENSGPAVETNLTNLDHLRWLLDDVPLHETEEHTTYRIDAEPTALAPWTYADRNPEGTYTRIGGGTFDPATGFYSQGAYNADDISRAAVVFLRDWQQNGTAASREDAYHTLRALTYLQTAAGPDAGRVVLWQQADGSLNPSAEPVELPDPSDSGESYWMARTLWALGEGYAAFSQDAPEFADFLAERLHLALDSLETTSLGDYGEWHTADGVDVPAWLIADGADATAEAVLGLSAYVAAEPGDDRARSALERYSEGVAAMSSGGVGEWPFGAVMPWALSQSLWHAWGGEAPAALASAAAVTGDLDLLDAAVADVGVFTPQLMTSGGPYNAWSPVPGEAQIAYGAESRLSGALETAEMTGGEGLVRLGGIIGGWFFGANPSGEPVYDPATGVTFDGVEPDGRVNYNSGAESTIHGQLAMLALDAHPEAARIATSLTGVTSYDGLVFVEAETGTLGDGAEVVTPPSAWTGEANWSGGAYVEVPAGGSVDIPVTDTGFVHPVIHRAADPAGVSHWYAVNAAGERTSLGTLENGGAGDRGVTENSGVLRPFPLHSELPEGTVALRVESDGMLLLDAVMLQPRVSSAVYETGGTPVTLYANATNTPVRTDAAAPGRGRTYTPAGDDRGETAAPMVRVVGAGFTIIGEPTTEEPTTEEPTTEEPTTEDPTTEEPTTEEPTTDRPTTEEPTTDRPTADRPTAEPVDGPSGGGLPATGADLALVGLATLGLLALGGVLIARRRVTR